MGEPLYYLPLRYGNWKTVNEVRQTLFKEIYYSANFK